MINTCYRFRNNLRWGFILVLLLITIGFSQPSINSVSGELIHGSTITINGSGFGIKNPAAPLMWDDCETAAVNNEAEVLSRGWLDPWPSRGTSSLEHRIKYRNIGYRNTSGPHQYSTKYLSGGHYQTPNNNPPYIGGAAEDYRNVMVTAYAGGRQPRWFAMWYLRHDPLWFASMDQAMNEKYDCLNGGPSGYYGSSFAYTGTKAHESSWIPTNAMRWNYHGAFFQFCDVDINYPEDYDLTNNPRLQWIKMEHRVASDDQLGFSDVFVDNVEALNFHSNCPNFWERMGGQYETNGIQSFTIGGFYRHGADVNDITTYRGDVNNFRYFDDMYVDTTLARVIIGDSPNYEQCTIMEPQIPFAWDNNTIICTVNLGRLDASSDVFIFVFNRDDQCNIVGFAIGGENPSRPTGMQVEP